MLFTHYKWVFGRRRNDITEEQLRYLHTYERRGLQRALRSNHTQSTLFCTLAENGNCNFWRTRVAEHSTEDSSITDWDFDFITRSNTRMRPALPVEFRRTLSNRASDTVIFSVPELQSCHLFFLQYRRVNVIVLVLRKEETPLRLLCLESYCKKGVLLFNIRYAFIRQIDRQNDREKE